MDASAPLRSSTASWTESAGLDAERALERARAGDREEAAEAFQSVLASLLVKEMRRSQSADLFGSGPGADAYGAWFDEHLSRTLVERDALGLAGMIKASIDRVAERERASEEG